VRELNADRRVLGFHEGDERPEALRLCLVPDAKIMLIDQANLLDGGCLNKDKPKAAQRIAAEMHVVKHAAGAARPGAVVDHGRHDQAVLQRQAADLERREQQRSCRIDATGDWDCHVIACRVRPCAGPNNSLF